MLYYLGQIFDQSLLMFPLVLGIYVSFSILKIADLSVDGSFVLGAAVFATMSSKGAPLYVALVAATLAGGLAGTLCALVQLRNRVDPLIAGILMAFILHSVSLVVMQRPNIGLLGEANLFHYLAEISGWPTNTAKLVVLVIMMGVIAIALSLFLSSRLGLWLKAFGNNQELVAMLGRNPERLRILGLSLGNALAALSGCMTAQASGYADVNMGFGQALIGIAMILLGRELMRLFKRKDAISDGLGIGCTFIGVILYFLLTNELIRYGLSPVYLKMAIGILLIVFLFLASDRAAQSRGLPT